MLDSIRRVKPDLVAFATIAYHGRLFRPQLALESAAFEVPDAISPGRTFLYSMGGNWINYLIPSAPARW